MSADNWRTCPNCMLEHKKKIQAANDKAKKAYGKVSPDEYEAMKQRAAEIPAEPEETLREDYEIGIDDAGNFFASYRGGCETCDFEFTFRHEEAAIAKAEGTPHE